MQKIFPDYKGAKLQVSSRSSLVGGACVARSVPRLALGSGSGQDPRVLGWSPASGTLLSREPASPSPSAAPSACGLLPSLT